MAQLAGFVDLTGEQTLPNLVAQPFGHDLTATQCHDVFEHEIRCRHGERKQQQHDQKADPTAGKDDAEESKKYSLAMKTLLKDETQGLLKE